MGVMILEEIQKWLPYRDERILLGLSGGPDSLCLMHVLREQNYRLISAHFNHKMRPQADAEAEYVQEVGRVMGLPVIIGQGDVRKFASSQSLSLEEAARIMRYQFLFHQAERHQVGAVVVAHHADDQVETVLMNLLRGSGLSGLTGMEPITLPNPWSETLPLIRPLLAVWKAEIEIYCEKHNLRYLEDPSNLDQEFTRNRIRKQLIPLMQSVFPQARKHLHQTAEILAGDEDTLKIIEGKVWKQILVEEGKEWVVFDRGGYLELTKGLQRRLIRLADHHLKSAPTETTFEQVERIRNFIQDNPIGENRHLGGKVNLILREGKVILANWGIRGVGGPCPQLDQEESIRLIPPEAIKLDQGWVLTAEKQKCPPDREPVPFFERDEYRVQIDADQAGPELAVGVRKPGERFQPLGMGGKSMKVSDFMVNEKLPAFAREHWPLIRSGDQVIWIPGYRIAHSVRLTGKTQRMYSLTLARSGDRD